MNDDQNGFFRGADTFTRMWSDFASRMLGSGMAFSPDSPPPEGMRQLRTTMFQAWSEYCDQFMRSAEFLETMKQSVGASLQARKQLNEFLGQAQHELQGASRKDVDQLMLALRHMERRMVDSMERLATQVDELGTRFEQLDKKLQTGSTNSGGTKAKSATD